MLKKIFYFIVFFVVFIFCPSWAIIAPVISHIPPLQVQEGQDLFLSTVIIDDGTIKESLIYYRSNSEEQFKSFKLPGDGKNYQITIPGMNIKAPFFEYYFEVHDNEGNTSFSPANNPKKNPYKVVVISTSKLKKKEENFKKPTGNFTTTIQKAFAEYPTDPATKPYTLMAIWPGFRVNYNFNAVTSKDKQLVTFWLNRETESYTNRTWDKFKLNTNYPDFNITAGDFTLSLTKYSVDEVQFKGLSLTPAKSSYQFFLGRSQKGSEESDVLSAIYTQYLLGFKQNFNFKKAGKLSLTFAENYDDKESVVNPPTDLKPVSNMIYNAYYEKNFKKNWGINTEYSNALVDLDTTDSSPKTTQTAYKFGLNYTTDETSFESYYRNVDTNFLTAGTLESAMDNDRRGFKTSISYAPTKSIYSLSSSYEKYRDNLDGSVGETTKTYDFKAVLGLSPKNLPSLSLSYGKLKNDGEITDSLYLSKGIASVYRTAGGKNFANTTLGGNYQKINYDSSTINLIVSLLSASVDTSYKDIFGISLGYNLTKTFEDVSGVTATTKKKVYQTGLIYNAIPFKFNSIFNYQLSLSNRSDGTVNIWNQIFSMQHNYYITQDKIITFEQRFEIYNDWVDTANRFSETVFNIKWYQNF